MTYKNIVCVTNLTPLCINAQRAAVRLAAAWQANLKVLTCGDLLSTGENINSSETSYLFTEESQQELELRFKLKNKQKEAIQTFEKIQKELGLDISERLSFETHLENEVSATIDFIDTHKGIFDLVIIGKQNESWWERLLFGSPSSEISHSIKITTLLIPSNEIYKNWIPAHIAVCTSLATKNSPAMKSAYEFAKMFASQITALHIVDKFSAEVNANPLNIFPVDYIPPTTDEMPEEMENKLTEIKKNLKQWAENLHKGNTHILPKTHVEFEKIGDGVIHFLKTFPEHNLLVINSSHSNALQRFFLGSNMDSIEAACYIPLLVVYKP